MSKRVAREKAEESQRRLVELRAAESEGLAEHFGGDVVMVSLALFERLLSDGMQRAPVRFLCLTTGTAARQTEKDAVFWEPMQDLWTGRKMKPSGHRARGGGT